MAAPLSVKVNLNNLNKTIREIEGITEYELKELTDEELQQLTSEWQEHLKKARGE
jgi:preprotein translocase subunit SecA